MSHSNAGFEAGLANNSAQLANKSSPQVPALHNLDDKSKRASNCGKRKSRDSERNHGGSLMNRGVEHGKGHDFVNLNEYGSVNEVIEVAFKCQHLSSRNMSAVWHRLSCLVVAPGHSHKQLQDRHRYHLGHELNTLVARTIDGLKEYSPMQLCQTTLGMAKIIKAICLRGNGREVTRHQTFRDILIGRVMERKNAIFQEIASAAVPLLSRFESQGYSNLAYACAIADAAPTFGGRTLLEHIACAIITQGDMRNFSPQELSNIVWAFATAKIDHPRLFKKVTEEVVAYRDLRHFTPQNLSNVIWAFATAEVSHPHLFEKVADEVIAHSDLRYFMPQSLSNIVWAFATAQIGDYCLFEKVAEEVTYRDLSSFKSQDISNIVWAFAKAKVSHLHMFEKVADEVIHSDLRSFDPCHLSIVVWAFSTADVSHPHLFEKVADEVIAYHDLRCFTPQNLCNIVWAFATARIADYCLFEKVAEEVTHRDLSSFKPQSISNIVWAFATANISQPSLFNKAADGIVAYHHLRTAKPQELAIIAWSYAVANFDAPELFNASFTNALREKMDSFNGSHLSQLYQWHVWQTKEKSHAGLPLVLERMCCKAFTSRNPKISLFQRDVVSILCSMGLNPKEEVLTGSGYSLDALVEVNGKQVGVEVDGPSHFIGRKPTGSTTLKQRQVVKVERIALVSVPYWEWGKAGRDFSKKQNYLCSLLGMK